MKKHLLSLLILMMCFVSIPVFSQTGNTAVADSNLLGLPGDNLDLYAVMDLFQKSKTIEEFEKSLNWKKQESITWIWIWIIKLISSKW